MELLRPKERQRMWLENRRTITRAIIVIGIIFGIVIIIQYLHLTATQPQPQTPTTQAQAQQEQQVLQPQQQDQHVLVSQYPTSEGATPTTKKDSAATNGGINTPAKRRRRRRREVSKDETKSIVRSILRTPDGRTMPDFETWLASDAASGPVPVATWLDSCAASLSVESSIAELFASKRAAWSLVGDDYLWYGNNRTVLMHLGFIVTQPAWAQAIRSHAISYSGEWIILADVCAALCALGFQLKLAADEDAMNSLIHPFTNNDPKKLDYEWIFSDYHGLGQLETSGFYPWSFQDRSSMWGANPPTNLDPTVNPPPYFSRSHHCRVMIQDWFGTSPTYSSHRNHSLSNFFATYKYQDLLGGQTGIGFLALPEPQPWTIQRGERKKQVLIWGKKTDYFIHLSNQDVPNANNLFRILHEHFTDGVLVSMAAKEYEDLPQELKRYITRNLGSLAPADFKSELRSSLVFLGLGEPLDGPSAMEALAYQTVFINPRKLPVSAQKIHSPVQDRRKYASQHMFIQQAIRPPLAYTIDIHDEKVLRETLKDIDAHSKDELPLLPPEFYARGHVHSLALLLQNSRHLCDPLRDLFVHPANRRSWSNQQRKALAEKFGKTWE